MPQFAVKDIRPNPFRYIDRYPIRREKIDALRGSLKTTGFWGNVVARVRNGHPEIAYGHHRLVALREEYGPDEKVDLIIRDLSDDLMLQIMARENMEEWGTSAWVEQETVRAVVEAYAEGKIALPLPDPKTDKRWLRYAPSFLLGDAPDARREHPYTVESIAAFLGWLEPNGRPQQKVQDALAALHFVQEGILQESDFIGLTTTQSRAVVEQARRAARQREEAAQLARQRAEEARREAEQAERRMREAEELRKKREAEAAKASDEASRRRAWEETQRAAEAKRRAEEQQRAAELRRAEEQRREQEEHAQARHQATTVGRAVSQGLQSGSIGVKQAATVREQVAEKVEGPPRDLNDIARRFSGELGNILDPDRDVRSKKLQTLVQYKASIRSDIRSDLVMTLERLASRATEFAEQLREGK